MPTSDVTPNGLATASYLSESGIILGGDILIIRVPKEVLNGNFLSFLISQYRSQVMSFVTGVTVYHLYASDMKKFKFRLPKIKEQEKIITPLLAINREIELLEDLAKKYKQQKQGLMQQLLTGKIRIQTP
jgi:type I restriction enzyme, S subunit